MELTSRDGKEPVGDWELYINEGDFWFRALIESTVLEENKKEWMEWNKPLDEKDLYTQVSQKSG